jgi:protein-S-isoprenylcysteine O-methyltransferase Ste14
VNPKTNSLVATLILVAVIAALYLSHSLIAKLPVGIGLQIAAAVLMLWARITFGVRSFHATANPTEGGLVTNGPYRFWRHPIYAAVLLFIWTGVLAQGAMPSLISLFLAAAATFATGIRIYSEEQLLRKTFPAYDDYSRRTKRLIPFIF